MNDNKGVLARVADQPPAILEDLTLPTDAATLAEFMVRSPLDGCRMTNWLDGVKVFQENLPGTKWITGRTAGRCAEEAGLCGINTLMLECAQSNR